MHTARDPDPTTTGRRITHKYAKAVQTGEPLLGGKGGSYRGHRGVRERPSAAPRTTSVRASQLAQPAKGATSRRSTTQPLPVDNTESVCATEKAQPNEGTSVRVRLANAAC